MAASGPPKRGKRRFCMGNLHNIPQRILSQVTNFSLEAAEEKKLFADLQNSSYNQIKINI